MTRGVKEAGRDARHLAWKEQLAWAIVAVASPGVSQITDAGGNIPAAASIAAPVFAPIPSRKNRTRPPESARDLEPC